MRRKLYSQKDSIYRCQLHLGVENKIPHRRFSAGWLHCLKIVPTKCRWSSLQLKPLFAFYANFVRISNEFQSVRRDVGTYDVDSDPTGSVFLVHRQKSVSTFKKTVHEEGMLMQIQSIKYFTNLLTSTAISTFCVREDKWNYTVQNCHIPSINSTSYQFLTCSLPKICLLSYNVSYIRNLTTPLLD